MPTSPTDLSRLETLAREATPGDWYVDPVRYPHTVGDPDGHRIVETYGKNRAANAAYIAAANPAAVLALIERVRELEADAARFRHIIAGAEHFPDPEPRPGSPISWGWSIQWGCWTHQGADIRDAIDATMTSGD